MRRFLTYYLGVIVAVASTVDVQAYYNTAAGSNSNSGGGPKAAGCAPANGKTYLDFNNVRALIETGGSMWQDRNAGVAAYEVPKGSGKNVIFSGSLWMGGTDVNGQLKLAAVKFRTDGNDFWPGPLSAIEGTGNYDPTQPGGSDLRRDYGQAEIIPEECIKYDKIYNISKAEVRNFITYWQCQNGLISGSDCENIEISTEVLERIKNWPAHGDPNLGQDFYLAPFYDNPDGPNGVNGVYDPEVDGDYPWYDFKGEVVDNCKDDRRITLYGDNTLWWVFNDKGNIHTESGADPIGMEIRAQAFTFQTNDEINNMTFYNYELINRSTQTLQDTYFAQYVDPDVGGPRDDYVGCDVGRGLAFAFNGDADDQTDQGAIGYGSTPPAVGVDFFEGPYQDDDGIDNAEGTGDGEALNGLGYGDGIVDNERYGMRKFLYYTNPGSNPPNYSTDPSSAADHYQYMRGFWKDGTRMVYGGTGHFTTSPYTGGSDNPAFYADFMFPGSSDTLNWGMPNQPETATFDAWDEVTENNPPGDRRFLQSAGPFVLQPGAVNNITVGVVFGSSPGDLKASVADMKIGDTKAQALFDACFQIVEPPHAPNLSARELENKAILFISNPVNSNNVQEDYFVRDRINIITPDELIQQGEVYDDTFRFEGYQIFQLADKDVSIQDLDDNSKARLVAVVDKKNGIDRAVNYIYNEDLDITVPYVRFQGEDEGLRHSFEIKEDLFATGANRNLVNHRKYYFIAVAFAYNEYKEYDPNDPLQLDGQKQPYLRSRITANGTQITPITVIPHKPELESEGTVLMADYGDGPQLTRIDGEGNGSNVLELTPDTEEAIVNNHYVEEPTYLGGNGPVDIKVVDPFNVASGDFIFALETQSADIDTADWYIVNLSTNDTVWSDTSINVGKEQLILDWGISVSIQQTEYEGTGLPENFTTDILSTLTTYEDSSRLWLGGVTDDDRYYPTNWIASGTYSPAANECIPGECLSNPCNYEDKGDVDQVYESLLSGTIAPFKLVRFSEESATPNETEAYCPPGLPMHKPDFFTSLGSAQNKAYITRLHSVDIVFTDDKTKWTRCPVFETGIESGLNEGQTKKMRLRSASSVDKEGNPDGTGTGMGWFPGYAINLETGERLNMAFGENSSLPNNNGRDMMWNPTSKMTNNVGQPVFGGMHFIYVFNSHVENSDMPNYDEGAYMKSQLDMETSISYQNVWKNCMYVGTPMLAEDQELLSNDVRISIRVAKKYEDVVVTGRNNGRPMYSFNMDDLVPSVAVDTTLESELLNFRAVPNPYYGYSSYETDQLDTRIKIVDIPQTCTVSIFNVSGSLVRRIDKDDPLTSVEWDLKNQNGIPIAGGVYIIHVETPDGKIGINKWFGAMRPPNLENF